MQSQERVILKFYKHKKMGKKVKQKFSKQTILGDVCINNHDWDNFNIAEQLVKIKEWIIPYGLLIQCSYINILNPISQIKFFSIKKLSLRSNRIQSLEPLCRTSMPSLKKLFLSNNWILNVNSLRKAYLPDLEVLQIDCNLVKEINRLTQGNFPNFKKLNTDRPDRYAGIQWIFKLAASLNTIQISSFKRIQHPQQIFQIKNKFPGIRIIKDW